LYVVTVPSPRPAAAQKAVLAWYRRHAAELLPERAVIWAKKMGVLVPLVMVRDRWRRFPDVTRGMTEMGHQDDDKSRGEC
jgi:hypothetical protein